MTVRNRKNTEKNNRETRERPKYVPGAISPGPLALAGTPSENAFVFSRSRRSENGAGNGVLGRAGRKNSLIIIERRKRSSGERVSERQKTKTRQQKIGPKQHREMNQRQYNRVLAVVNTVSIPLPLPKHRSSERVERENYDYQKCTHNQPPENR